MSNSISPTSSYEIRIESWEARNSMWVQTPTIIDLQLQDTILEFRDPYWSLNNAEWISNTDVKVTLRKYPGNHIPAELAIEVECKHRLATLPNGQQVAITALEDQLDLLLQWKES
jgi:hypothetical protein